MEIGIRVSRDIEDLYKVTSQISQDKIWEINYGADWKNSVLKIAGAIGHLYDSREANSELEIDFSFSSAQLLKRMILVFLKRNTDPALKLKMLDFVLVIEDRIETEVERAAIEHSPIVRSWNK